jgi:hypothetical protein
MSQPNKHTTPRGGEITPLSHNGGVFSLSKQVTAVNVEHLVFDIKK